MSERSYHGATSRSRVVLKMRDDNGFQDVPLTSWPIKIALNSDQINLATMQTTSPHAITEPPPNGMVAWMLLAA